MKILKKYWGVFLVVVLLSTLWVSGTAAPASAATLAWSAGAAPNPLLSNQVVASDVSLVRVASNGDIFVVDNSTFTGSKIWKSVNGGYSWTQALITSANITDLQFSPAYTSDGYLYAAGYITGGATPGGYVYQSSNRGTTFVQLGGAIGGATTQVMSLSVDPSFAMGLGQIMVGTVDTAASAYGNVYIWGQLGILNWTAQGLAADVTSVAFSPSYPIDQTILAVGTTDFPTMGTFVHSKVFTNAWDAAGNFGSANLSIATRDFGNVNGIIRTSIAFPSDFNASNPATCVYYIGTTSANVSDDVFRINLFSGVGTIATDINYNNSAGDHDIYSVAYAGTTASGTLYAGLTTAAAYQTNAFAGSATLAGVSWVPGALLGGITGATCAFVVPTASAIFVGTTGAESALNMSVNGGMSYQQVGLINTTLSTITKLVAISTTEEFIATSDGAGGPESLWKTTDGALWARVDNVVSVTNNMSIAASPNFATDNTLYWYEVGAPNAAPKLRITQDGGSTFANRFFPAAFSTAPSGAAAVVAVDATTLYAADIGSAAIWKSTNNAFFWTAQLMTAGGTATGFYSLTRDASGVMLAGSINGLAYLNTDGLYWTQQGLAPSTATNMAVAIDANYAATGYIYAAPTTGLATGIWRFNTAAPTLGWTNIVPARNIVGLLVTPDGTLYGANLAAAAVGVGGVTRVLDPAAFVPVNIEQLDTVDGLTAGATLFTVSSAGGSNVLYSVDNALGAGFYRVFTFSDTFANGAGTPGVSSPADGDVVVVGFTVTVTAPAGAPVTATYVVSFDTRADFLTAGANVAVNGLTMISGADNSGSVAGQTVYFRVRMQTPVIGPWSQAYSVINRLAPAAAAPGPVVAIGGNGTTGPGGYNVALTPTFNWIQVTGATGYEFQLGTDPTLASTLVDMSGANALGAVTSYVPPITLKYSTTYYWRVRGITGASQSLWSNINAFTTLDMPEASAPPVIVPSTYPTPTVVVTVPPATTTQIVIPPAQTKEVNPSYIWAIIIVGAVLVIAVIVLIVRTRRSV